MKDADIDRAIERIQVYPVAAAVSGRGCRTRLARRGPNRIRVRVDGRTVGHWHRRHFGPRLTDPTGWRPDRRMRRYLGGAVSPALTVWSLPTIMFTVAIGRRSLGLATVMPERIQHSLDRVLRARDLRARPWMLALPERLKERCG